MKKIKLSIFICVSFFGFLNATIWEADLKKAKAEPTETTNYYELLVVPKTATPTEINKAYKKLALEYHPDKLLQKGISKESKEYEEMQELFKKMTQAKETLTNPETKREYDRVLINK